MRHRRDDPDGVDGVRLDRRRLALPRASREEHQLHLNAPVHPPKATPGGGERSRPSTRSWCYPTPRTVSRPSMRSWCYLTPNPSGDLLPLDALLVLSPPPCPNRPLVNLISRSLVYVSRFRSRRHEIDGARKVKVDRILGRSKFAQSQCILTSTSDHVQRAVLLTR